MRAKSIPIADAELPKCVVCNEKNGKAVNADFLAFIAVRYSRKIEFQEWNLVCKKHRRTFAAFQLVKDS